MRGRRGAILMSFLTALSNGCFAAGYVAQQTAGQLKLLTERRRIVDVLADPELSADTRRRLTLAFRARQFGVDVLGLRDGDNFDRYVETHGAPIAWNVTAAYADRLELVTYRFPFVGQVPYLGFFKQADAERVAAKFRQRGLDVSLRAVAGYSTLGYFADPIYSSMIDGPDARIVEVVLHEMLHGTLYIKGESAFNESLATFVGLEGAALFFAAHDGQSAAVAVIADAAEAARYEAAFADFLHGVLAELRALYAAPLTSAEKLARRQSVFTRAQAEYRRRFPTAPGTTATFVAHPLNNALLLSYAVYHEDTDLHRRLFTRVGNDLGKFVRLYKQAAKKQDAEAWLTEIADRKRPMPLL